jgi:hypothetical protein
MVCPIVMYLILFISDRIVFLHKQLCRRRAKPGRKSTGLFCLMEKEDAMKLIVIVLIVRLLLQMISNKNEEEKNNNDEDVQENVMHPAVHQLR